MYLHGVFVDCGLFRIEFGVSREVERQTAQFSHLNNYMFNVNGSAKIFFIVNQINLQIPIQTS